MVGQSTVMKRRNEVKNPTVYLKMRVLGAIDFAIGKSITERIKKIAETTFVDEQGIQRRFTWRTIQVWYSRYNGSSPQFA